MKPSPMNTMTEASTGAWENGRTMSRSMATPPRKEIDDRHDEGQPIGRAVSIIFQAK